MEEVLSFIAIVVGIVGTILGLALGVVIVGTIPECNMYNKLHDTEYSVFEYILCGDVIKNYNKESGTYINLKVN